MYSVSSPQELFPCSSPAVQAAASAGADAARRSVDSALCAASSFACDLHITEMQFHRTYVARVATQDQLTCGLRFMLQPLLIRSYIWQTEAWEVERAARVTLTWGVTMGLFRFAFAFIFGNREMVASATGWEKNRGLCPSVYFMWFDFSLSLLSSFPQQPNKSPFVIIVRHSHGWKADRKCNTSLTVSWFVLFTAR